MLLWQQTRTRSEHSSGKPPPLKNGWGNLLRCLSTQTYVHDCRRVLNREQHERSGHFHTGQHVQPTPLPHNTNMYYTTVNSSLSDHAPTMMDTCRFDRHLSRSNPASTRQNVSAVFQKWSRDWSEIVQLSTLVTRKAKYGTVPASFSHGLLQLKRRFEQNDWFALETAQP